MAEMLVAVIGGPTASGKSALALGLAQRFGGTVINADSMQVYRELRVLTARPSPEEEALVPHRLYGVLPASEPCSAARWRAMALDEIRAAHESGRLPIVVGGTGLYLRALMEGLAEIPPIPLGVRQAARERLALHGAPGLHAELASRDPVMAARLAPGDSQRLVRAWEVLEATGRSLAEWQALPHGQRPAGLRFLPVRVLPPRDVLYARCDRRFLSMIEQGAVEEVRQLDALGLDPELPAMKALGVPELRACLHGAMTLEAATAAAQMQTRRYAKRQTTWFRHQWATLHGCHVVGAQENESVEREISRILREIH